MAWPWLDMNRRAAVYAMPRKAASPQVGYQQFRIFHSELAIELIGRFAAELANPLINDAGNSPFAPYLAHNALKFGWSELSAIDGEKRGYKDLFGLVLLDSHSPKCTFWLRAQQSKRHLGVFHLNQALLDLSVHAVNSFPSFFHN